jgi:hypothetical protein
MLRGCFMPPHGLINEEDRQQKLPGDDSPPFSAPSGAQDLTDDTHPQADMLPDPHEQYDEGIAGAEEVEDKGDRGVEGYEPPLGGDKN